MEQRYLAEEFGQRLAAGTVAHVLSREAKLTSGPILPYPVSLEPPFSRLDPLQTFARTPERLVRQATPSSPWSSRRFLLPSLSVVDWRRAETVVGTLAGCCLPMSFEVYATSQRASIYIGAPIEQLGFLASAWLAAYPEASLLDTADPIDDVAAHQLSLFDWYADAPYHRAVRASQTVTMWASFFALCASLGPDELLFCQVIFQPTRELWQENISAIVQAETALRHRSPHGRSIAVKNLAEPLYAAVIRMGTTRASLSSSMQSLTGLFTVDGHCFHSRTMEDYRQVLNDAQLLSMLRERTSHTVGQLMTSTELSLIVHLPDSLAAGPVRLDVISGLPVPTALQEPGLLLGVNTTRGVPVSVFQPLRQANRSAWYIGTSRKGKSTALVHKIRALARAGEGVGVIDPHRNMVFDVLESLDDVDPGRVLWLDFDATLPVAYNAFAQHDPSEYGRLATDYVHTFKRLFDTEGYYRTLHLLGNIIYGLLVLEANLGTIPLLVARNATGEQLRNKIIQLAPNNSVRRFWQDEFPRLAPAAVAPITSRIAALLLDDRTQRTFAQTENRIDFASAMDEGKVILIAPPASIDAAALVIGFIVAEFKDAALRRAGTPRASRHFHLVIDECHRAIQSSNALQSIIDEAAKGGLSVSLANQETGQLPTDFLKALYSVTNIFVFGVNLPDARALAPLFTGRVVPETLASLPPGSVYARIGSEIVNFQSPPPLRIADHHVAARIIAQSQSAYAPVTARAPERPARRIIETFTEDV